MRTRVFLQLFGLLLLPVAAAAQTSLGGLFPDDPLSRVFQVMGNPNQIVALRGETEADDWAMLVWIPKQTSVHLNAEGNLIDVIRTTSPEVLTGDGLKVGDSRQKVISEHGTAEKVITENGLTVFYYWSQGIAFAFDPENTVISISVFTLRLVTEEIQQMTPQPQVPDVEHRFLRDGDKSYIIGRVSNPTDISLQDVRVGVTLRDKGGQVAEVVLERIGRLAPKSGIPFKINVPPKDKWSDYQLDTQVTGSPGAPSPLDLKRLRKKITYINEHTVD